MAHRVNTEMQEVQPTRLNSTSYRPHAHACGNQLPSRDDAMLTIREVCQPPFPPDRRPTSILLLCR
jgi:hypothetical protein